MQTRTQIISAFAAVLTLTATGMAMAKDHDRAMKHNINPEAIAACAAQTEGANVVFNHPMWGNVNAVCGKTPDNQLVAMPAKMMAHIKQAVTACVGKKNGDKVTVSDMRDATKTIEAVCSLRGDTLVAHPKRMHEDRKNEMHPPM